MRSAFHCSESKVPLPAERLSCIYIQWLAYKYAIFEERWWENCVCPTHTEISCVARGNKRFGNLINVNFVRRKIDSPREHFTSFPLVTGKIEKAYLVRNFFFYLNDEIFVIFSNWEPGAQPKFAHAYYVFSL